MTPLEQIKKIEETSYDCEIHDMKFLLKAFRVMREIAIDKHYLAEDYEDKVVESVDREFEERMGK